MRGVREVRLREHNWILDEEGMDLYDFRILDRGLKRCSSGAAVKKSSQINNSNRHDAVVLGASSSRNLWGSKVARASSGSLVSNDCGFLTRK